MADIRAMLEERRESGEFEEVEKPAKPKKKRAPAKKVSMEPPVWDAVKWPQERIRFMSFDQTLGACGWALMETGDGIVPRVIDAGTFKVDIGRKGTGFRETMEKGDLLFGAVRAMLLHYGPGLDVVVHEMPAVKGFMAYSSTMAACRVRDAVCTIGLRERIIIMQAQHAKKTVCGNGNAEKPQVHAQFPLAYLGHEERFPQKTDEDQRDAIANGLASVMDGSLMECYQRRPS